MTDWASLTRYFGPRSKVTFEATLSATENVCGCAGIMMRGYDGKLTLDSDLARHFGTWII